MNEFLSSLLITVAIIGAIIIRRDADSFNNTMRTSVPAVLLCICLLCTFSCSNHKKPSNNLSASLTPKAARDTIPRNEYKFFDFYFDGTKESFLKESRKSKVFTTNDYTAIVNIFGTTWWFTEICTDSLGIVSKIRLHAPDASRRVFEVVKTEFTPYLGEPYITESRMILWRQGPIKAYFGPYRGQLGWYLVLDNIGACKYYVRQRICCEKNSCFF